MKALEILLSEKNHHLDIFEQNKELGNPNENSYFIALNEAIKEIKDLIQENKSLTKTLEKYNEEMLKLRLENQELIRVLIDAQETINKIREKDNGTVC